MQRPDYDDPAWCEREYNARTTVPDVLEIIGRWPALAAATRARLPYEADVAYGPHPRQTMDLFRAARPRGACMFVHGGYWRALSKAEFSWIAEALAANGITAAIVNYPLCPDVTVADITAGCRAAVATLWRRLSEPERGGFVIAGHSAGGYIVADAFCNEWSSFGLPDEPFAGGLAISGVFELAPLLRTTMNAEIRMSPAQAAAWSLHQTRPVLSAPVVFALGSAESAEFHRQSQHQQRLWSGNARPILALEGRNHFDVLDSFRETPSLLVDAVTGLARRCA